MHNYFIMGSETTKEHGTSENLLPRKMPPSARRGNLKKLRLQEIAIRVSVDRERGLRTKPGSIPNMKIKCTRTRGYIENKSI